jgi:hypothetical protein
MYENHETWINAQDRQSLVMVHHLFVTILEQQPSSKL